MLPAAAVPFLLVPFFPLGPNCHQCRVGLMSVKVTLLSQCVTCQGEVAHWFWFVHLRVLRLWPWRVWLDVDQGTLLC